MIQKFEKEHVISTAKDQRIPDLMGEEVYASDYEDFHVALRGKLTSVHIKKSCPFCIGEIHPYKYIYAIPFGG